MTSRTRSDLQYLSTKTYTHSVGLSCCFRQWRATKSHCRFLHGYALEVKLTFTGELDDKNWVVDFGGLKPVKAWLEGQFDHKLLVAEDDPAIHDLVELQLDHVADVVIVKNTGCEAFAQMIYEYVESWISLTNNSLRNVKLVEVEVREHAGNSAIVRSSRSV